MASCIYGQSLTPPPQLKTAHHSVLLDFDGTLVELVDRPDQIVIERSLIDLIGNLHLSFRGRLALVSGRSIAQLEAFFQSDIDGVGLVGSHGAEIKIGADYYVSEPPAALLEAMRAIQAQFDGCAGVLIEVKTLGVAVHYRLAPAAQPKVHEFIRNLAMAHGLFVQEGKMMVELREVGRDKGSGIDALMQMVPFVGSTPVFVGDDVTDEAGFSAVSALGGFGVMVGPPRGTKALHRLADVSAVRAWLGGAK